MAKKSKKDETLTLDQFDLEFLEESTYLNWFRKYGRYTLLGIILLVILFAIGFQYSRSVRQQSQLDYLNAEKNFETFQKSSDPLMQQEAIKNLQAILDRTPSLQAKYNGLIAQTFINDNEIEESKPYATQALGYVKEEDLPNYVEFSENALIIGSQDFTTALQNTNKLKAQLISENKTNTTIFAFNLLRIAILQQLIGTPNEEHQSWQEWKHYKTEGKPIIFKTLDSLFKEGKFTLDDYIDNRIGRLKEKKL